MVLNIAFTTALGVLALMFYVSVIGRAIACLLPKSIQHDAALFLSPALGLGFILVFIASLGRYFPFADSIIFPLLIFVSLVISLQKLKNEKYVARYALWVAIYSLAASTTILTSLSVVGALNPHNDTFTYLAQSQWLQGNAFNDALNENTVSPASTQVLMYQTEGFRMGASYLLGLFHSLLNIQWAFDVYPAVVAIAVASGSLAMGFPIAPLLSKVQFWQKLIPSIIVANSLGGMSFGAYYGFLPQSYGIMFGAAFLFIVGRHLPVLVEFKSHWALIRYSIPPSLLLASSIFSYSEFAPFVIICTIISTTLAVVYFRALRQFIIFFFAVTVLTSIFLNVEIARSYRALLVQSGAVVGGPIDWPLLGFIAHAAGLHGGGWDIAQWSRGLPHVFQFLVLIAMGTLLTVCTYKVYRNKSMTELIVLSPTLVMLPILGIALLYFRYVVDNPFGVGVGQSWSQFKLSDWSHLFMTVWLLSLMLPTLLDNRYKTPILIGCLTLSVAVGIGIGARRSNAIASYYHKENVSNYLKDLRARILNYCGDRSDYFIDLRGNDHKLRQLLSIYLADRNIKSNWTGDGYIENTMPVLRRVEALAKGDCLIEVASTSKISQGETLGIIRYRLVDDLNREVKITLMHSENDMETDGKNWWVWVSKSAIFSIASNDNGMLRRSNFIFVSNSGSSQKVLVELTLKIGEKLVIQKTIPQGVTENVIPLEVAPSEIDSILFKAEEEPQAISGTDRRTANFMLMNLRFAPD